MYFKYKKISNISSVFQANLFKHYRRLLAPLNPIVSIFQNWVVLISFILLGYALLHSTFVVFGTSLIWLFIPISKTILWYKPISLTFWIFSISFCTTLHSLKICYSLPKEFRLVLLIEQGLTIKSFIDRIPNTQNKFGFLLLTLLLLLFFFPKFTIILIWAAPLICEFYCLSEITNKYLGQKINNPTQTFAALLGFDYNYVTSVNIKNQFVVTDEFLDDDLELPDEIIFSGEDTRDEVFQDEDEFDYFDTEEELESDDLEDAIWETDDFLFRKRVLQPTIIEKKNKTKPEKTIREMYKSKLETDQVIEKPSLFNELYPLTYFDDLSKFRQQFPEYAQYETLSSDFQRQYKKVPLLYKYLQGYKKPVQQTNLNYVSVENRLWTNLKVNSSVLRVPSSLPWYNSDMTLLFDHTFLKYEQLSDYYNEKDFLHFSDADEDLEEDLQADTLDEHLTELELVGPETDIYAEPGAGDEFRAPNWFWISFFFRTLGFWCFLNFFIFLFFCFCGIPESWLLSTRQSASNNILIYKTLLQMTEQLYTSWGFTRLPIGNRFRLEYFNFMQPSYYPRKIKFCNKTWTYIWGYKKTMFNVRYWGKTATSTSFYSISTGLSSFSKKYSDFNSFLFRQRSSILQVNRLTLAQNINDITFNTDFFEKKTKSVNDFYATMQIINKQKVF